MIRAKKGMAPGECLRWYGFWLLDWIKGGAVRKYYDQIERADRRGVSPEEVQEKIKRLIEHATRTTTFYKDFPSDTPLEALPLMDKNKYREEYEAHLSSVYKDAGDNRIMYTSGSTGTPFSMIQDRNKINHNTAAGIYLSTIGGYYIGMRWTFIRRWVRQVNKGKLEFLKENMVFIDSAVLDEEAIFNILAILKKKRVKYVMGYASSLSAISRYIDEHKVDMSGFRVQTILSTSEALADRSRDRLRAQFGCPVGSWYSNEENGNIGIAVDGLQEGYYIDSESYYIELLKLDSDEPAEDGQVGRVVITDLYNYAFPILRYDNGDLAVAHRQDMGDGRYRLFFKEVYGRRSDMIYDSEGRLISPYCITNGMWGVGGINQWRFIQTGTMEYTMELSGDEQVIDTADVLKRLTPYLGQQAKVSIKFVDEIPVLRSGKRKYIENRCPAYAEKKFSV